MRSLPRTLLLALALVGLLAPAARAERVVEGEGYALRLPPGFRPISLSDLGAVMPFPGIVGGVRVNSDLRAYLRGSMEQPESLLLVMWVEVKCNVRGADDHDGNLVQMERGVRAALQQLTDDYEVERSQKTTVADGMTALEIVARYEHFDAGPRSAYALALVEDRQMLMLYLDARRDLETVTDLEWGALLRSIEWRDGGSFLDFLFPWGLLILGGLGFLVGVVRRLGPAPPRYGTYGAQEQDWRTVRVAPGETPRGDGPPGWRPSRPMPVPQAGHRLVVPRLGASSSALDADAPPPAGLSKRAPLRPLRAPPPGLVAPPDLWVPEGAGSEDSGEDEAG